MRTAEDVESLHGDEAGGCLPVLRVTQDCDRDTVALLQHHAEPVELKVAKLQAAAHILHCGNQLAQRGCLHIRGPGPTSALGQALAEFGQDDAAVDRRR